MANSPQLAEAKKYVYEALEALQSLSEPNTRIEIMATQSLQKAQQALSAAKTTLSTSEKKEVEISEQAILKAKQVILESELNNNK